MLIKSRVPGTDMTFYSHISIRYSASNMHKHHQCRLYLLQGYHLTLGKKKKRIMHLPCPVRHDEKAPVAMLGYRHHLQWVCFQVFCIQMHLAGENDLPPEECLMHNCPIDLAMPEHENPSRSSSLSNRVLAEANSILQLHQLGS